MNVQAETLYEAVVLAIRAFREHECAPGAGSQLEVEAKSPSVTHTVNMAKVQDWLRSSAKSPSDQDHEGAADATRSPSPCGYRTLKLAGSQRGHFRAAC